MKPVWTFIILCFGFSWAVAALIWQFCGLNHTDAGTATLIPLFMFLFMCGPAIAAIACAAIYNRGRQIAALGLIPVLNVWLFWAWLSAIVFVLASLGLTLLASTVEFQNPVTGIQVMLEAQNAPASAIEVLDKPVMAWVLALQAAVLGVLINGVLLLSEELGWRGWLWDHYKEVGFWRKNILIGFIWGVWHTPVILMGHNYPGMPVAGACLFILFCILVSPIIGYLRERNGSVWAASIFHGTLNATAGVALLAQTSIDMPWRGSVGVGGFVVLVAMVGTVWVQRRRIAE